MSSRPAADTSSFLPVPPVALAAGAGAALIGAVVWGAIAYFTGYEVGFVAWAIGGLVGWTVAMLGGRGTTCAAAAAGITVLGIFVGKLGATSLVVGDELSRGDTAEMFTPELFAELQTDASDFAALGANPSSSEVREFMVDHAYTDATEPFAVAQDELQGFEEWQGPVLAEMARTSPTFEQWQRQMAADVRGAMESELSVFALVVDDLTPIDLLFAFFAISTAFGIVQRASADSGAGEVVRFERPDDSEHRRAA